MWLLLMKPITSPAQERKRRGDGVSAITHPAAATIVAISVPSNTPGARFIDAGSLAYSALCRTPADAIMGQ
jgi:hypothetical protein